jgi:uncharacterized protein with HEPN domain
MSSEELRRTRRAVEAARANIALIRQWAENRTLTALRTDTLRRYAIERAFIAIDAAVRDIPGPLVKAHALPARLIAGFRNVLAHSYDDILDERVILTIRDDLPALDAALAALLEDCERR